MPKPQHTTPCKECPFRRQSLRGYLGASNAEEFAAVASSEQRMPCHMTVNYEKPDWRKKQLKAPQCAGRAVMWKNQCKIPRNPELVIPVEVDRAGVFSHVVEFKQYHERETNDADSD